MNQRTAARILVVDDNLLVAHVLARPLILAGFTVSVAGSGTEAIALAARQTEPFAFALFDIQMPEMDGPETAARLREMFPALQYVFVTGDLGCYTTEQLLQEGALAVFLKPVSPDELVHAVQQFMAAEKRSDVGVRLVDPAAPGTTS